MAKSAARSEAEKDPALPQTRRARRRLIGAAALAIAAAVVLTLVLDSEPREPIREVEVSIPSRTTPSVDAGQAMPPRPDTAPRADTGAAGAVEGRVGVPMVPPPDELPADSAESPIESPAMAPVPAESAEPGSDPAPAEQAPAEPELAETEQAETEQAEAESVPEPRASSGSPAKRRSPGADVADGSPSTDTTADSRAAAPGPAAGAQSPRADQGAASSPGPAKAPAGGAAAGAGSAAGTAAPARRFSVQVGAFSSDATAEAQAQRVRDAGLPVFTERILTAQGARIRVRAGPFDSGEEAERASAKLKLAGIESAAIIKP
ncbi:MAG: SPOR domain-containing protein [Burkholderiaceae bacterium]